MDTRLSALLREMREVLRDPAARSWLLEREEALHEVSNALNAVVLDLRRLKAEAERQRNASGAGLPEA